MKRMTETGSWAPVTTLKEETGRGELSSRMVKSFWPSVVTGWPDLVSTTTSSLICCDDGDVAGVETAGEACCAAVESEPANSTARKAQTNFVTGMGKLQLNS